MIKDFLKIIPFIQILIGLVLKITKINLLEIENSAYTIIVFAICNLLVFKNYEDKFYSKEDKKNKHEDYYFGTIWMSFLSLIIGFFSYILTAIMFSYILNIKTEEIKIIIIGITIIIMVYNYLKKTKRRQN